MKKTIVSALLILLASVFTPLLAQAQTPVAGTDYIVIADGEPMEPADGMVVVEEFFSYICPACNMFEPPFLIWQSKLPSYVKVVHIPATFRADFAAYAQVYYAAESLGLVEQSHEEVYDAVHRFRTLPGEGQRIDEAKIAEFYSQYGVEADKFLAAMKSFSVSVKVRRATAHMEQSKIPSTPSLVVNGKYLVRGRTYDDMLRVASYLIEKEHAG